MNVLNVSRTPVVGVAAILTDLMNKYMSGVKAGCIAPDHYNNRKVYGTQQSRPEDVDNADVVIIHNSPPADLVERLKTVPCVRMVHSQPSLVRNQPTGRWKIPFGVVAQYWPRTWEGYEFSLLPNLIDLYDERFRPKEVPLDRIKVAYFPSHGQKHAPGSALFGNNKGVEETLAALRDLDIDLDYGQDIDFWECMERKRNAHIVIDECVTGGYHRASLEGACMGKVAVNNMDRETRLCLEEVSNSPFGEYPFLTTGTAKLYDALRSILAHKFAVRCIGNYAREWMEKYWQPSDLLERCYRPLLESAKRPVDVGL